MLPRELSKRAFEESIRNSKKPSISPRRSAKIPPHHSYKCVPMPGSRCPIPPSFPHHLSVDPAPSAARWHWSVDGGKSLCPFLGVLVPRDCPGVIGANPFGTDRQRFWCVSLSNSVLRVIYSRRIFFALLYILFFNYMQVN